MLQYLLAAPPKRTAFFPTNIMSKKLSPYPAFTALKKWADKEAKSGGIAK